MHCVFYGKSLLQIIDWIHDLSVDADLIMHVRACTEACAAHIGNDLTALHLLTGTDHNLLCMSVAGHDAIAMIDIDHVAIAAGIPAGRRHHAISCRYDRRTEIIGDIDTRMEIRAAPAHAIRRAHVAAGRPNGRNRRTDAILNRNDLLKFRNFGKKSLTELDDLLANLNLHFGMDVTPYKLDKD